MRRKLLLADDSVTIQRVIELTFADEDIDVVAVGDGDAAIARLDSTPPDIVLADVGMPGRDGYEVAMHVHRTPALAHIPVVLLTGALQPVDEAKAREAACAGVLVKPFEPQMVIAKVRELLDKREASPDAGGRPSASAGARAGATPADAIMNAPPSNQAGVQTQEDYFAQLDAAFATLNATAGSGAESQRPAPSSTTASATATSAPPLDSPQSDAPTGRAYSMGDAFSALLALEQGGGSRTDDWSTALTAIVDEVARRVAEQVAERVVREIAPDVVTRVADRVVREEIERLRHDIESS